jgi:hypothetical protein
MHREELPVLRQDHHWRAAASIASAIAVTDCSL